MKCSKASELYSLFISLRNAVSMSPKYFEIFFYKSIFTWKDVYTHLRIVTINTRLCAFQYKVLTN